jgi:hypothetical protein
MPRVEFLKKSQIRGRLDVAPTLFDTDVAIDMHQVSVHRSAIQYTENT